MIIRSDPLTTLQNLDSYYDTAGSILDYFDNNILKKFE
jgi:hypothetical protein